MLFRQQFLDGIRDGRVTLAFRRWQRPSVLPGSTQLTPAGELTIAKVTPVTDEEITHDDARLAGYDSREALLKELNTRSNGTLYRIELGALRADPRIALRETDTFQANEMELLLQKLQRLDRRAAMSWTQQTMEILEIHPAVRAGDLCGLLGQEKEAFKLNVRKLKNLGLTESLGTGYRLSPRGRLVLATLRAHAPQAKKDN